MSKNPPPWRRDRQPRRVEVEQRSAQTHRTFHAFEPQPQPSPPAIGRSPSKNQHWQHDKKGPGRDGINVEPFSNVNREPLGPRSRLAERAGHYRVETEKRDARRGCETDEEPGLEPKDTHDEEERHRDSQCTASDAPSVGSPTSPSRERPRDHRRDFQDKSSNFVSEATMAPIAPTARELESLPGPRPSLIEVAKPYVFEERIRSALEGVGMSNSMSRESPREDSIRMNGVLWIDQVRRVLQL